MTIKNKEKTKEYLVHYLAVEIDSLIEPLEPTTAKKLLKTVLEFSKPVKLRGRITSWTISTSPEKDVFNFIVFHFKIMEILED